MENITDYEPYVKMITELTNNMGILGFFLQIFQIIIFQFISFVFLQFKSSNKTIKNQQESITKINSTLNHIQEIIPDSNNKIRSLLIDIEKLISNYESRLTMYEEELSQKEEEIQQLEDKQSLKQEQKKKELLEFIIQEIQTFYFNDQVQQIMESDKTIKEKFENLRDQTLFYLNKIFNQDEILSFLKLYNKNSNTYKNQYKFIFYKDEVNKNE